MSEIGHNSAAMKEKAIRILNEYSESLKRSQDENDVRAELREEAKDLGLDTKALQNAVTWAKSSLKQREGYDESLDFFKACVADDGGAESLFKWVIEREEEKERQREEKRAEKQKQKAKDDEYKEAPDRQPGPVKSIGEQQAEAILNAPEEG